jgi:autotransporter-associated beta strand protein
MGQSGSGTLIITNGQTYNVSSLLRLNNSTASNNATILMNGGTLNYSGPNEIRINSGTGAGNTAYLVLNSNALVTATKIQRQNLGADAAIEWNDGTIANYAGTNLTIQANGTTNGIMNVRLAGTGTHTFDAESGRTITVAATAQLQDKSGENGTLNKTGAGSLVLQGANTYSGATTISAGSLILGTNGSIASSSVLNVASGATLDVSAVSGGFSVGASQTLKGSGTVVGNTTINGSLQPGSSPGLLSFNNDLTLGNTAATTMEINGAGVRGTDFDAVDVTGLLTYDGALTLTIGTTFAAGNYSFHLFDFGSQSGSFDTVTLGGSYAGSLTNNGFGVWGLTSGNETWGYAQDTGILQLGVVPEPSTYALLALAAVGAGVGALRRRRSAQRQ